MLAQTTMSYYEGKKDLTKKRLALPKIESMFVTRKGFAERSSNLFVKEMRSNNTSKSRNRID